ncbi:hypothetical protein [Microbacterium sp. NPDC090003]|uniref:hypothetical protein n=1 Tax=Microbacterium sp. NPDC090003 TaxID=3364203 RepID=UPI0037F5F47B
MNAHRIEDWKLSRSLDQGHGALVDEWYALFHLIEPRLREAMHAWSTETQPRAVNSDYVGGRWTVDQEETFDWVPDGSATVVEMTRATEELADDIVEKLVALFRAQAAELIAEGGNERDLSQHPRIALRLDFIADMYGSEKDGVWTPMPEEGVLVAAKATIHPT